jgi:hypothetical protein
MGWGGRRIKMINGMVRGSRVLMRRNEFFCFLIMLMRRANTLLMKFKMLSARTAHRFLFSQCSAECVQEGLRDHKDCPVPGSLEHCKGKNFFVKAIAFL